MDVVSVSTQIPVVSRLVWSHSSHTVSWSLLQLRTLKVDSIWWRAEIKCCTKQCWRVPLWCGVQPRQTNGNLNIFILRYTVLIRYLFGCDEESVEWLESISNNWWIQYCINKCKPRTNSKKRRWFYNRACAWIMINMKNAVTLAISLACPSFFFLCQQ